MCTNEELRSENRKLSNEISSLKKENKELGSRIDELKSEMVLFRATMTELQECLNDLNRDKRHDLFRKKRDEDAFISIMVKLESSVKDLVLKTASLENRINCLPCLAQNECSE